MHIFDRYSAEVLRTYRLSEINRICISNSNFSILSLHGNNSKVDDTLVDCIRRTDVLVFIGKVG